jgi:hypothetical protein
VGLWIQIVLGPSGGNNLGTEVLIVGQAAHGRRVKAQSRCPAYETVVRRREHLSLQATQRGGLAQVQISKCKSASANHTLASYSGAGVSGGDLFLGKDGRSAYDSLTEGHHRLVERAH